MNPGVWRLSVIPKFTGLKYDRSFAISRVSCIMHWHAGVLGGFGCEISPYIRLECRIFLLVLDDSSPKSICLEVHTVEFATCLMGWDRKIGTRDHFHTPIHPPTALL